MYTTADYARDLDRLFSAVPDTGWQRVLCSCLHSLTLAESARCAPAQGGTPNPLGERAALLAQTLAKLPDTKPTPQPQLLREQLIGRLYPLDVDAQTWAVYRTLTPAQYAHLVRGIARQRLVSVYGPGVYTPEKGFRRVLLTLQVDGPDTFIREATALADLIANDFTDAAAATLRRWNDLCAQKLAPAAPEKED